MKTKFKTLLCLFCLLSTYSYAQYCIDGSYCPNPVFDASGTGNGCFPGIDDEYGSAQTVQLSTSSSSTCEISQVWGDLAQDENGEYRFYLGVFHGNGGQATFRFYINTDCDSMTGQLLAPQNFGDPCPNTGAPCVDVGGAEYMLLFTAGPQPVFSLYQYDTTLMEMVQQPIGAVDILTGDIDGCSGSDGDFIEMSIPFLEVFDPCLNNGCGSVEITTSLSNAGGSVNSSYCEGISLELSIPVNQPPMAVINPVPPCQYADTEVCLDGSPSFDPDTNIVMYEWDFDFDGVSFTPDSTGEYICRKFPAGEHTVALRVVDTFGCSDTTSNLNSITFNVFDVSNKITCQIDDVNNLSCYGGVDGSFEFSISGGITPYSYIVIDEMDAEVANEVNATGSMFVISGLAPGSYSIYSTDSLGCVDSCNLDLVVIDTIAPMLICPNDTVLNCPADTSALSTGEPGVMDECNSLATIISKSDAIMPGVCNNAFVITRTWTISDTSGNDTSCIQTITVQDTTKPIFQDVPADYTVDCDALSYPPAPSATDACGTATVVVDSTIVPGSCPNEYTKIYIWTATDLCQNSVVDSTVVTVQDTTKPMLENVPMDYTNDCDALTYPDFPTATDLCGTATVAVDSSIVPGSCPNEYTKIYIWTATDLCQNSVVDSTVVTVQDTTKPMLSNVPMDYTNDCDALTYPDFPTATDACGTATVAVDSTIVTGSCPNEYTKIYIWTATDLCQNSVVDSTVVTVQDTTKPMLENVPMDYTNDCDALTYPDFPTATDLCGIATVVVDSTIIPGSCENDYTKIYIWTATDLCQNSVVDSTVVTVQDTAKPMLENVPMDYTNDCDALTYPDFPTATDLCGMATVAVDSTIVPGSCPNEYTKIYIWTAIDLCLNLVVDSTVVTVQDTTKPMLANVPTDYTNDCNALTYPDFPSATDACGTATVSVDSTIIPGSCPNEYTKIYIWTATDLCQNSVVDSTVVTVQDTTKPMLANVPMDYTNDCNALTYPDFPTATDLCGTATVAVDSTIVPGSCPNEYTKIYIWTATDLCQNSVVDSTVVTVQDTTKPMLENVPIDYTNDCEALTYPDFPTATDLCGTATVSVDSTIVPGSCPNEYTKIYIWTATDLCQNSVVDSTVVTVQDTTKPMLENVPMDYTNDCDALIYPDSPTATDLCGTATVVVDSTIIPGSCENDYTKIYIWTATDLCQNSVVDSTVVTVQDTAKPILANVPMDYTNDCDALTYPDFPTATDLCGMATVAVDSTIVPGSCPNEYTKIYIWTAIDLCLNLVVDSTVVTVQDTTKPMLENVPMDYTNDCDALTYPDFPTATDFCGTATVAVDSTIVPGNCPNEYTKIYIWTATDLCQNSVVDSTVVTVQDTTPPSITCPPDSVLMSLSDTTISITGLATGSDLCSNTTISYSDMTATNACGSVDTVYRTWRAIDECGNENSCVQTLIISGVPDLTTTIQVTPSVVASGGDSLSVIVNVIEVLGQNTFSPIQVAIPKISFIDVNYNSGQSMINFIPVQNNLWDFVDTGAFWQFTRNSVLPCSSVSTFGFKTEVNTGAVLGRTNFTSIILFGSGGEINLSNNQDSESAIFDQE